MLGIRRYFCIVLLTCVLANGCASRSQPANSPPEVFWQSVKFDTVASPVIMDGTAYISGKKHLYTVAMDSGQLIWTFNPGGALTPPLVDGPVYVGSIDGNVYALHPKNGQHIWTFNAGDPITTIPYSAQNTIYVVSETGRLYAIDQQIGNERWHLDLEGQIAQLHSLSPFTGHLVIIDPLLYISTYDGENQIGRLYAIDLDTRKVRWKVEEPRWLSAPATDLQRLYLGTADGILALEAHTGQIIWRTKTGSRLGTPLVADNILYASATASGTGGPPGILSPEERNKEPYNQPGVVAVEKGSGQIIWQYVTDAASMSTPARADERVYLTDIHSIYVVHAKTGEQEQVYEFVDPLGPQPTVHDGVVYIGSDVGKVYRLKE